MAARSTVRLAHRPSLAFILLCILLAVDWLAGGASRPDVMGQVIVRGAAWGVIVIALLGNVRPELYRVRAPALLLFAAFALVAIQLVPLPPQIWQSLPGRTLFASPAIIAGEALSWRPLAIIPDAAINAVSSLIVPFAALLLAAGAAERDRTRLPQVLLVLVVLSMLVGLLQFSGVVFDHPLVNDTPGDVNGGFANRNHFALFLAIGILLVPAWAFSGERRAGWRLPIAAGLILLFILSILATGSRAGMALGVLALFIGSLNARRGIRRELGRAPRWMTAVVVGAALVAVIGLVGFSVSADRAASVNRALDLDTAQDMRSRAFPTVVAMATRYFPAGSGFGGFEPLFRVSEPFDLLKPSYFNHAHNDFIEVSIDGGIAGIALLAAALAWTIVRGVRAIRAGSSLGRLGAGTLLLVFAASLSDYPARTPMIMAIVMLAAVWLCPEEGAVERSALPARNPGL